MSPKQKKSATALVKSEKALKKHAAKKSLAKKHGPEHRVKKHEPKHGPHGKGGEGKGAKDLRRAYEHLARVAVLLTHRDGEPKLRAAAHHLASLVTDDLRGAHASPKLAAELARAVRNYTKAMECVRAAEALASSLEHVG